jgi:UDP-N-acetyl-2-amino-2-deoxyglucuronate dehydrogenase
MEGVMGSNEYGVGLIGAGGVAGEYVQAFRDHPQTEIIGIYNRTPGKAARLMASHSVEGQEYGTIDQFFADDRIQIVVSCTHPHLRAEHCTRAAETGRHVVIEKPVGLSLRETAQIRDAVAKAGVKTVTSFVLRWNPQFQTVRQLIEDGVLGELIYGEADYWHPASPERVSPDSPYLAKQYVGSAVLVGGCHALDVLRFLGGEIAEVTAFSAGPKRNKAFDYPPVAVAALKFAYVFNCRLFGTEGTIQNNRVYSSKHYPGATDYWAFPTVRPDSGDVSHHPFTEEIAHFVACIENDVESHASIYDSYRTMAVCFAIDESAASGGQPVSVPND